jgi:hypothetical protein
MKRCPLNWDDGSSYDPNLLSHAGLAPLMALAERAGLPGLLAGVRPGGPCGVNAASKVACLLAGMAAGADSIDDMDLLRDGATGTVFAGVRAPSTLGSHLRSYTWGNVRQLDAAHRKFLAALARDGRMLPGRETLTFIDIDSTQHRVYGYQKEGAAFGHAKVQGKPLLLRGLNPLVSVISTPLSAPVLGPVRLRGGNAASARGAAGHAAEAIGTARDAGCTGKIVVRLDSAYYNAATIGTIRRNRAHFSVTVPMNSSVRATIAAIPEDAWTAIEYPQAIKLYEFLRPGVRENECVGLVAKTLYDLGSEFVEGVNAISGERCAPHPHVYSDRIVRPGDPAFFDILHSYNGYRTCYYRTFAVGSASSAQRDAYTRCREYMDQAISLVRPGATTADIVSVWPSAQEFGFADEEAAFALQYGHGVGLSIWEKPLFSRLVSLDHPEILEEGMVFALEMYWPSADGWGAARIEEEVVVTADGCELITKFPAEDLLVAGQRYYTVSGPLSTERDSQSHLNTETGRARVRS